MSTNPTLCFKVDSGLCAGAWICASTLASVKAQKIATITELIKFVICLYLIGFNQKMNRIDFAATHHGTSLQRVSFHSVFCFLFRSKYPFRPHPEVSHQYAFTTFQAFSTPSHGIFLSSDQSNS